VDPRKFFKVVFFERAESAEKMSGNKFIVDPKTNHRKAVPIRIPMKIEYLPTEHVEARGGYQCDLTFTSFLVYMKRIYKQSPRTKAIAVILDDGFISLRIFCWNPVLDEQYKKTDKGRQISWDETLCPKGTKFVGIDGFGIGYYKEPDSIRVFDEPFDYFKLIQKFLAHKPECGSFLLQDNKLILELHRGSNVEDFQEKVSKLASKGEHEFLKEREAKSEDLETRQSMIQKTQLEKEKIAYKEKFKDKDDLVWSTQKSFKEARRGEVPLNKYNEFFDDEEGEY